jgi:hypothetical protein
VPISFVLSAGPEVLTPVLMKSCVLRDLRSDTRYLYIILSRYVNVDDIRTAVMPHTSHDNLLESLQTCRVLT